MNLLRSLTLAAAATAMIVAAPQAEAQTYKLKLAHFVPESHPVSKWLVTWAKKIETDSAGAIQITVIPGSQMGPPTKYYDLVRRGQIDFAWFAQGFTPGRFPLTEISNLPYLAGSGEIGSQMVNDPALRAKYLDKEHKGTRVLVLFTHQPGNINSHDKPIRRVEDMKGMRMRFASATIRSFITAMGGTPVGMPPTQIVESMQKGTLDGAWIDYGGAGLAFRLGPVTKYTTEMYSYITSFGFAMNDRRYKSMPAKLRALIDASVAGKAKEIGGLFDGMDAPGKAAMVKSGMTPITLTPEEDKRFKEIGAKVAEAKLAELEKRGLPARAVYKMMQDLSAKYAKTSRNFWK